MKDEAMVKMMNAITDRLKQNPKLIKPALRMFPASQKRKPNVAERELERNTKESKPNAPKKEKCSKKANVEKRRSRSCNANVQTGEYRFESRSPERLSVKKKKVSRDKLNDKNGRKAKAKVNDDGSAAHKEAKKNVSYQYCMYILQRNLHKCNYYSR